MHFHTFTRSSFCSPWINNKQHAGDMRYNYPLWSSSSVTTMRNRVNTLSGAVALTSPLSCRLLVSGDRMRQRRLEIKRFSSAKSQMLSWFKIKKDWGSYKLSPKSFPWNRSVIRILIQYTKYFSDVLCKFCSQPVWCIFLSKCSFWKVDLYFRLDSFRFIWASIDWIKSSSIEFACWSIPSR